MTRKTPDVLGSGSRTSSIESKHRDSWGTPDEAWKNRVNLAVLRAEEEGKRIEEIARIKAGLASKAEEASFIKDVLGSVEEDKDSGWSFKKLFAPVESSAPSGAGFGAWLGAGVGELAGGVQWLGRKVEEGWDGFWTDIQLWGEKHGPKKLIGFMKKVPILGLPFKWLFKKPEKPLAERRKEKKRNKAKANKQKKKKQER